MNRLIKTDFKRILHDKLFLVMCIIGGAFAVITPLIYVVMFAAMGSDAMMDELLGGLNTAKGLFFDAFSLGNNFGLIGPVFLAIVLCKDFSFGTVRNKIISGHKRSDIFLSMFVACSVVLFITVFLQALISFAMGLLVFDLGIESSDIGHILLSLFMELLLYIAVSAFVCWLCVAMKNVGLVIVLYVAVLMVLTMVSSIIMVIIILLKAEGAGETVVKILEVFQNVNLFNYGTMIGKGNSYTTEQLCYLLIVPSAWTALMLLLGLMKFNKKDLK